MLLRSCPQLTLCALSFDIDLRRIIPLFSAVLRYTTLRVLGLICCKIDDKTLFYLGSEIRDNQHLEVLQLTDNSFTVKGLLSFLILLINDKSVLEHVEVSKTLKNPLMKITGYSYVISQIECVRRIFSKKTFSITFAQYKKNTPMEYRQSAAAQMVELPAPFSRRDVL